MTYQHKTPPRTRRQQTARIEDDIVATVPAETLSSPVSMLPSEGADLSAGALYVAAGHAARDGAFPCFKKARWATRGVVKIVWEHELTHSQGI